MATHEITITIHIPQLFIWTFLGFAKLDLFLIYLILKMTKFVRTWSFHGIKCGICREKNCSIVLRLKRVVSADNCGILIAIASRGLREAPLSIPATVLQRGPASDLFSSGDIGRS
jgi:hypothetical protein